MEYQKGQSRDQLALFTTCLDDMVPADNSVRFIDAFVESLDPDKMGFKPIATQGRPPYHPADLLKLYIYGYMNRMRSSRRLEKECERNLEVIRLLKNLNHIITKRTIEVASADAGLITLAYNLKRLFNLGVKMRPEYNLKSILAYLRLVFIRKRLFSLFPGSQNRFPGFYPFRTEMPNSGFRAGFLMKLV